MVKNSKEKENVNNFQDARPVDISRMNAETLDMELEKGYADMQAGRTKSAAQVFADIRRDYNV
jgi:DNA-damage-inducible protein J